jgi:Tol biopolymer transport system component/predicted Ser/Thr protein kinase
MPLATGARLGPYEILAPIGAGGMGEVYRARDTRLDRTVAIKICAEQFSERFEREARAISALNHPNICTLHDVGPNYLVMEYIEGPTLSGPIPLAEALPIARQIAEALEAAHEKGIVHRDLKPANIKLTADGKVKVLDFGLAAVAQTSRSVSCDPANSPTLTISATLAGTILGTAAYMSPEQARGATVDKRADIWSYGVVLYEMLTGREMFGGETISDTLAAVLRADIDWPALPPETPATIRRLLRRCLERDRKKRLADIADARLEIDEALAGAPVEKAAAPVRTRVLPWVLATMLLAVGLLAVLLVHFRESPPENRLLKLQIQPPEKTAFGSLAVSPDGRLLAFTATDSSGSVQLWVRPLDSFTARPLAASDGHSSLFWSPDSRFIGFFAAGKLKKVEASGGSVQTICAAPNGRNGTWNRDGVILFEAYSTPLFIVAAAGGEAKALTSVDASRKESAHRWPSFLPDGRHFLYTVLSPQLENSGIYLGALDSKDRTRLAGDTSNAAYASGYLLFARARTLMAQRFDAGKLQPAGEPRPVAEQVGQNFVSGLAMYSASENGLLVYGSSDATASSGIDSQLTWFDRTGKRLETIGESGINSRPQLSPDEKRVVVDRLDPRANNYDLWLIELERGIPTRFTFDPGNDWGPVWSPDGARIAFASNRLGNFDLYVKASSGAGKEELLLKTEQRKFPTDWSFDGRFLLYSQNDPKTNSDLWVLALSDKKPTPFLRTEFNERDASFSPDGKWIAYTSDESGKDEIYVQTFPASGGKWQISTSGGSRARWRRDGKELFYLAADQKIMAVEVTTGAIFRAGVPKPLFETRITGPYVRFAVTANGQRFLLPAPVGDAVPTPATVVINWTAGIK